MHSQRLRRVISLGSRSLSERIMSFWDHPHFAEAYPEFLFATYGVICASTPLMHAAAVECRQRSATDELAAALEPYLREHAEEEDGHDEWLLRDLELCGVGRSRVLERVPYPSVAALAGAPYYWSKHVHPVAFLGYLAVLENPASPAFLERVAERSGLPFEAMSTHLEHARLDETHVAEFDAMLDGLPLTERHTEILAASAISAVSHLDHFFADVLEHFDRVEDPLLAETIFTMQRADRIAPLAADAPAIQVV